MSGKGSSYFAVIILALLLYNWVNFYHFQIEILGNLHALLVQIGKKGAIYKETTRKTFLLQSIAKTLRSCIFFCKKKTEKWFGIK